jgi:hypothetical protein
MRAEKVFTKGVLTSPSKSIHRWAITFGGGIE